MGVVKKLNEAKKRQQAAEEAMPAAYEDRLAGDIDAALGKLGSANDAGFDYSMTDDRYQNYQQDLRQRRAAGAAAAAQGAAALGGGYGTDWAQGTASQTAAALQEVPDLRPLDLRAQALQQWQDERNNTNSLLDVLMTQSGIDRTMYDGAVANAQYQRDMAAHRTDMAQEANDHFWSTLWNTAKGLGGAALNAYDAYKGYEQQKWERDFAERKYSDSLSRTDLANQTEALERAASLWKGGFYDEARTMLKQYGLDETLLDAWTGEPVTRQDQMTYLLKAAGLMSNGDVAGARSLLTMAGLDPDAVESYETLVRKQNQADLDLYAQKKAIDRRYASGGSGGSSRSGSSRSGSGRSGSSRSGSGFTTSQLTTISRAFNSMGQDEPMYETYKDILQAAGWLPQDSAATGSGGSGTGSRSYSGSGSYSSGTSSRLPGSTTTRRTPYSTQGSVDGMSGASGSFAESRLRNNGGGKFDTALSEAQRMANGGYSADTIGEYLMRKGYSDDVIARVSNVMGW